MKEESWTRWIIQTARSWKDISEVVRQTGVEHIDIDHRRLIESALELNRLIDAFEDNSIDLDTIRREAVLLERLRDITAAHFEWEERFIQLHGLPNLDRQKEQHRAFLVMVDGHLRDFKEGRLWVSLSLKMAVLQWVVNHINHVDYETFCLENWVERVLTNAAKWQDVADVIKPTGLHLFDQEHKDLVVLTLRMNEWIERYQSAGHTEESREPVATLLHRIRQYAEAHFSHEEHFIARYQIPNQKDQVASHHVFLTTVQQLEDRIRQGEKVDPRQVKKLVMNWWVEHINRIDYASFRLENWTDRLLGVSTSWDNLEELIKSTGLERLDQEHMDLIMLTLEANEVVEACQRGNLDPALKSQGIAILHHLHEFSAAHFQGEEAFIRTNGIPGYERQQQEHRRFLEMVQQLEADMANGRIVFSSQIKTRILSWWMHHINEVDYNTFRIERWAGAMILGAREYQDLANLVKPSGLEWVDADHRQLVEVTLKACRQLVDRDPGVVRGLEEVMRFSSDHFHREENYFVEHGLWGIEIHRDQHQEFLATMRTMIDHSDLNRPEEIETFRLWIVQWWVQHINEADYRAFQQIERIGKGHDQAE
ncbi:MAG: hemerythrin family protein [Magnetococcales bacterium]|nr:hemerythrin family protein [Magnetococcales bacterium]NGZ07067.1 hemerythrin family protein [Magnetococcales bacterium]